MTAKTDDLATKLWDSLPKAEQDEHDLGSFCYGVELAMMEHLDELADALDDGFDAGVLWTGVPISDESKERMALEKKIRRQRLVEEFEAEAPIPD